MTEENFIDFKCPYCTETVSFPGDFAGRAQECPLCAEIVVVPKDGREVGQKLPLPLTTPRLVLRRLTGIDWKDLQEFMADEEMYRYVEGHPLAEEDLVQWLEADGYVKLTTPNQPFRLGLEVKASHKVIGLLSLTFTDPSRLQAVVNLFVNRSHQRNGFAAEALAALLSFCFEGIGLHRVTANCDRRNTAACRLVEKAGLRREGEFRKNRFLNGEWVDTIWYAMLREDYRQGQCNPGNATTP